MPRSTQEILGIPYEVGRQGLFDEVREQRRTRQPPPEAPSPDQWTLLCASAFLDLEYVWFQNEIDPPADRYMVRLLLAVYLRHASLKPPMPKKDAWQVTGVADIKTARKYIQIAEANGLIESVQSDEDKRLELLALTKKGIKLVREELAFLLDRQRVLMSWVAEHSLPETAAPHLAPVPRVRNERAF